jgi:dephospho-CoA kinase
MLTGVMATVGVIVTGAPGSGKSVTLQALSDLLTDLAVEHGAIESEQLAWGYPWLPFGDMVGQLQAVLAAQARIGRRLFLVAATPETDEQLDALVEAVGGESVLVVALRASSDVVAERLLRREPAEWSGLARLTEHARYLTETTPHLRRVDTVIDTQDRSPSDVARLIYEAMASTTRLEGRIGP